VFGEKEFKLVVSPIHPPLGDIKVLSVCLYKHGKRGINICVDNKNPQTNSPGRRGIGVRSGSSICVTSITLRSGRRVWKKYEKLELHFDHSMQLNWC
jgi:hypothetical protein